tara:strand:+ start:333 stop:1100 length:768 start_codon:yes stop_codon:yes gene_type:complete
MATAKDILIKPINAKAANSLIKRIHYSGTHTQNSQLHLGAFLNGRLEGAMQFGPPIDRRKILPLVKNTKWNNMIELNRMAFSEVLPRNSESRAMAVAFRLIKKNYPHIEWVISFSDACQSGDGTIYRASGFVLTGIKKNRTMLLMPDGTIKADKTLNDNLVKKSGWWKKNGAKALEGYQLRYIYFINSEARNRLTVPILPFSKIDEIGAGMYKGVKRSIKPFPERVESVDSDTLAVHARDGGAIPTSTLQGATHG